MDAEQCRLCLRVHSNLVDVFDEKEDNLWEKISMFYGIKIDKDEPITKKICRRCYYLTNSTYEHRVAFQENQLLLKTKPKIEVKTELTQNDFLNNLKLTNNTHKSINNLKRKYPNINIPECCNDLDLEPYVDVLSSPKQQTWGDTRRSLRRTISSTSSSSSNVTNELICPKCQRTFKLPRYLKKHRCVPQHQRTKPQHQCPHCPKNFESKLYFDHHLLSHQKSPEKEVFKSPRAPLQSTQINTINTDLKVLLDYNEVINESISKLSREKLSAINKPEQQELPPIETTKSSSSDLLVEGEEVNAFVCLTCNKVFDTLDLLNNHKKYAHKLSLRCDKCTKKFTVVELLMKHQETHRSAEEEQKNCEDAEERRTEEEQKKCKDAEKPEIKRSKIVARKRTGGALFISKNSESSSDSTSTSSSSDDDCVITDEFTKKTEPLETALEPQSNNPPIEFISTSFEEKLDSNGDDSDVLIIDSDSECGDDANKQNADKQNSDKRNSDKQKEKEDLLTVQLDTESTSSSSSTANTYTRPTSQEGPCVMLENEVSYLNYLYNKCNYEETTADQGTQYWKLELLNKFARQAVLPIEINRVIEPHVTVKYTPTHSKVKPTIPQIPWNYNKAIDLNGGSHAKTYKAKQCNQQLSKNQKASIKVPIPVKPKLINGPKNNQYTTKYVPNEVNTTKLKKQIYIVSPNQLEGQTNIQEALQAQNIPNTNQSRSILKNVLTPTPTTTTSPQPIVYTYVPTTPIIQNQNFVTTTTTTSASSTPGTEVQPFVLNGLQFQSVTNKNPTFVFQQIGQPNFINMAPPTFFTTSDNNPSIYLNQQTNIMQPSEIIEPTSTTTDQEQDQGKEQTNQVNDGVHRPMIRIKSLSELTAKTPEPLKDDNKSYLNVYANYVNARL